MSALARRLVPLTSPAARPLPLLRSLFVLVSCGLSNISVTCGFSRRAKKNDPELQQALCERHLSVQQYVQARSVAAKSS